MSSMVRSRNTLGSTALMAFVLAALMSLPTCSTGTPADLAELAIRAELRDAPGDSVLCISVDGADAPTPLLHDLAKTGRKFVPASECVYVMDTNRGSYHRPSGQSATLIDVTANASRTEVKYVSEHHGKWGMSVTLKVKQMDGQWRIVDTVDRWAN
jgi:hypothetical protein